MTAKRKSWNFAHKKNALRKHANDRLQIKHITDPKDYNAGPRAEETVLGPVEKSFANKSTAKSIPPTELSLEKRQFLIEAFSRT
jgi:hypothetical protein